MKKRARGPLIGGLALALVATLGGMEVLPDRSPDHTDKTASAKDDQGGFLSRLGDAARGLADGGAGRAKPEAVSAGLFREEKPLAGRKWPAQKRVKELTGKRTENSKVYQLSDGRLQAEISSVPLHYQDDDGRFKPIDTTVRPVNERGYVQGNRTNTYTSLFGDSSDDLVRFERDGRSIELGLAGASKAVTPKVSGSTVTYPGVAGGADVVYDVTSTALKEKIVLRQAPAGPVSYTFTLDTAGLTAQQREDGSIAFLGRDGGAPVFVMPAPFMYDSKDDKSSPHGKVWSDKVSQRVQQMYGQTTVTVSADAGWLADQARVYPVVIDPTIKVQPVPTDAQDVQIYSGATTTNYNDTYQLKVGTDSSQSWRSLVKFDVGSIPQNTPIDDAQLQMYYSQTHTDWQYDVAMEARRVTQPWSESTATWAGMNANMAAQPAGNMVTKDDGDSGTSIVGTWTYSGNATLTPLAVNGDYRYNDDATTGHTHTWVPTITEAGDYQVEVHFVTESDRPTNAPYTVYYNGGSKTYTVDQTTPAAKGVWKTLGVHPFVAGTTGKVVLGDVASKSVIADAVRFTKWGASTKKAGVSSVWSSFPVRNVVQDWVNGTPNYGFMVKAVDEATKGRGGPIFEASEYAYNNDRRDFNLPKLVVTYGRQGVTVNAPTTITSTGAVLDWPAYVDPSTATGDDIVEYQVHRSIYQNFTPSAATLIAPVSTGTRTYQDTTAVPTAADNTDPMARKFYYYMVAVKTRDGQVIAGPTQPAMLPKAGQITRIYRTGQTDTTLSQTRSTENVDVYDGDPYVSPGNNSSYYGDTRGLIKFASLTGIPTDAKIVGAELRMYNTYLYPGTDTNEYVDVYKLKRNFVETKATWASYDGVNPWLTAGGEYDTSWKASFNGFTNDPEWETWDVTPAVDGWVKDPTKNFGLLLRQRDETNQTARAMLLSSEAQEPLLRPTLEVTYLEQTAESTYYAASTPTLATADSAYTVPVTLSNPTLTAWNPSDWELAYDWKRADGVTDGADASYELKTALPATIPAGGTLDVAAQVKTPPSSVEGNKRTDYVLQWDLRNKLTGKKLSETVPAIQPLPQNVAVEEPTSDQLGLEKFYSYAGKNTGAGGTLMNNLYSGNTVWSYNAFNNPSRGLSTFVRLAYNSLDTSDTVAGYGWSLQASTMMRLGTPLDFHPNPNPTKVTFTDGDGTSHWFTWDATAGEWRSPKGVHLYLQQNKVCDNKSQERKAWVLTKPDRTQFFYDCDGFLSSVVDNNQNEMLFTYEERKSNNKPTKFLKYLTDPTGRITLTIDYYAKGQTYDYIDDTTWNRVSGATNLTNPKIIDHISQITDISGRKLTFTYTDKGLLGELVDGYGSTNGAPKTFKFAYDMTQGNKNVKLVKVTDPRGNPTSLVYNYPQTGDDPKFHWTTKSYTDRLGYLTQFGYVDPDGPQGNNINATVTDAENHATQYLLDGYGRAYQFTNAKNEVTKTGWDDDHNVIRLEEANGAVSTWAFDPKTGYPTETKDAEAVKNGWPGTVLTYQRSLNGYVADLTARTSPEGRKWTFGYTAAGDIQWAVDPMGNTTAEADDYKSYYTYDDWGQLLTAKDPNGNVTSSGSYDATGSPRTITDALSHTTQFVYDERGQVTKVTDALQKVASQSYDTFGRLLDQTTPVSAGRSITTPAPTYDTNDNILEAFAPNGAVTVASYDKADRVSYRLDPVDKAGDPQRKTSFTYDKVGNLLTTTEPKGNLTTSVDGDFVTTYGYDAISQLISVVNADGYKVSYEYDAVGNLTTVTDPRKNLTADPDDRNAIYTYNQNHWVTRTKDAAGHETVAEYDRDGNVVARTDEAGVRTTITLDPRELVTEVTVPHEDVNGVITSNVTKYEYDQAGNQTKVISPRGVATTDDPDDFAQVSVYDALNRVKEIQFPFDRDDPKNSTPDKTFQTYDQVGRLTKVSAPPSAGQTVRNDTVYTYFDNGWLASSTDAWNIKTTFDYNNLGQQTKRTTTSGGGGTSHTVTWSYYLDGKLANMSDEGIPTGSHEMVVDDSEPGVTQGGPAWTPQTTGTGYLGTDYRTHAAGGQDVFVWKPFIDQSQEGTYEVFVQYPSVSGAATNAKYTINTVGGAVVKTVDQTQNAGQWVSLGKYQFSAATGAWIQLTPDGANGTVVADGVQLIRDTAGIPDTEYKNVDYIYDANSNLVDVSDHSSQARFGHFLFEYNGLNQTTKVTEDGPSPHSSTYAYDPNGNLAKRTYDDEVVTLDYDSRDLPAKVTRAVSATDPSPKSTLYTYTPRKQFQTITKGNGNKVDYGYYLDGRVRTQVEKNTTGAVIADHLLSYNANGNRDTDTFKVMNADNNGAYLNRVHTYQYDPRDRVIGISKNDPATGQAAGEENYQLDANSNVVEARINGKLTTSKYDRNRLMSSTTDGAASEFYYDPFGRLETVSSGDDAGGIEAQYRYDGFDRKTHYSTYQGPGGYNTTRYFYDAFDRLTAKREYAGASNERETVFNYLGMSSQVLSEGPYDSTKTVQTIEQSYSYGAFGERLAQDRHNTDGSRDTTYYSYNAHGDVEAVTTATGVTRATYGYTAYGADEEALFTGADKPDPANPNKVPYNVYRFNSKRWDPGTSTYDMGARDYSPQWSRFLTRDFHGAGAADMGLDLSSGTANRYAFAGGNPINVTEVDGHYGVGDFWNDVVGVFKGAGKAGLESFGQAVAFTTFAMMDPDEAAGVVEETANYAVHNPGEFAKAMWHGVWDPIQADWTAGRHGEAIGRGLFEVGSIALGAKGTTSAVNGIRRAFTGNRAIPGITRAGMSTSGKRIADTLARKGSMTLGSGVPIKALAEASEFLNAEIGVIQNLETGVMRAILGDATGVKFGRLPKNVAVIAHTHPVFRSLEGDFTMDLSVAGNRLEVAVDWGGNVTHFRKGEIVQNPSVPLVNDRGYLVGHR